MFPVSAIQFNVHDLDAAITFYCDRLGFELDIKRHYPALVTLKNKGFYLILNKVDRPRQPGYPDEAQTVVNFRVPDLAALMADPALHFLQDEPQPCPVGRYAALADPSGNIMELVQFDCETPD